MHNIFKWQLYTYQDILSYWASKNMHALDSVKPIVLLRAIQACMFFAVQTVHDLELVAMLAVQALDDFPLSSELSLEKLQTAITVYSEECSLDWGEQSKIWLFALSLLGGKEGIIRWQELYPVYSAALSEFLMWHNPPIEEPTLRILNKTTYAKGRNGIFRNP
jgi:hypothetical protein